MAVEEDLLKNPFNLKGWMRYIDRKRDSPMETVHFIYERAIKELPGSYKLWKLYLDLRRVQLQKQSRSEMNEEIRVQMQQDVNHCYERALVFMHKVGSLPGVIVVIHYDHVSLSLCTLILFLPSCLFVYLI